MSFCHEVLKKYGEQSLPAIWLGPIALGGEARVVNDSQYDTDGTKLHFTDGTWLLVRGSGTEPLLRLYAEAQDPEMVAGLLDWAEGMAETL